MSDRLVDSLALFGKGAGNGTDGPFTCDICQEHYPETPGETAVHWDLFGSLQVGDCCFDTVERAAFNNRRQILAWFAHILEKRAIATAHEQFLVDALREAFTSEAPTPAL